MSMSYSQILIQSIGLIAMSIDVYASLSKSDSKLKKFAGLASLIFSLHYFMLGAIPGALTEILNGTRTVLSAYTQKRIWGFSFLGIYAVLLFLIPNSLVESLPFIASLSITTGLYFCQGIVLRLCYLVGWILWLVYSIHAFSIGGMILFVILLITTTTTIIRLYRSQ